MTDFSWVDSPGGLSPAMRRQLLHCWTDVSNAGGAVGFPMLPVGTDDVEPALAALVAALAPTGSRLLIAAEHGALAGWLVLTVNPGTLIGHWARITRVQTALTARGRGIGSALMQEAARYARGELRLDELVLAVRGGVGLESFYARLGWIEYGRQPRALRLSADDFRDEVLMHLPLPAGEGLAAAPA
ncbi:GNAT family N-acetyltransferase [Arthrobacter yangruifuii]|uniref:GNAT family N-acetyltransferase n=1 Tax=Arthrobacter yangruifuii TaxID=2606616 RepID=A0A5N6MQZ5_9MICC|nr:GNAT family N-acetyltransferase [Arthrobacter yangruifuii]KAD3720714.1 GNAT family N-acetyltransferase [Arthrobacter yangruifuii]